MRSGTYSAAESFERKRVRPRLGRTLIVGSRVYMGKPDRRLLYEHAIGVDMQAGEGVDLVANLEESVDLGVFAHVECISVLEHSRRPWLLAATIEALLEPGGTLHVQAPFVWRVHDYPGDFWRFTKDGIASLFPGIEFASLMYAHVSLKSNNMMDTVEVGGHPYIARTEVCGFGVRR